MISNCGSDTPIGSASVDAGSLPPKGHASFGRIMEDA